MKMWGFFPKMAWVKGLYTGTCVVKVHFPAHQIGGLIWSWVKRIMGWWVYGFRGNWLYYSFTHLFLAYLKTPSNMGFLSFQISSQQFVMEQFKLSHHAIFQVLKGVEICLWRV
jgi:hypothetical protein